MSDSRSAVRVDGLSKEYVLGAIVGQAFTYGSLRDSIVAAASGVFRAPRASVPQKFWALRDISFDVPRGQVVGIIGRNGAGKSTLLKILSRITRPTVGEARLDGRVGSLLEVGTGFHPELSGRENILLNGAILGMRRADIRRRFDEIVAFSGVAPFLDTPVKRYSSGMYVRLAFAVAAHMEPEILIVDEVLAVGDAEFQRKCLGKLQTVVAEGRTVLFVSHNMAAIKALCQRALLLEGGRLIADGPVDAVVDQYLGSAATETAYLQQGAATRPGTGEARIVSLQVGSIDGRTRSEMYLGEPIQVIVSVVVHTAIADPVFEIGVSTSDGMRIVTAFSSDGGRTPVPLPAGRHDIAVDIDTALLPHRYTVDLAIHHQSLGRTIDLAESAGSFTVVNVAASGSDKNFSGAVRGYVRPVCRWRSPAFASAPHSDEHELH